MGKAWIQDAYTQVDLTLKAMKLASEFLREGGTFVTKVFRSNDYNSLLWACNQLFRKVEATKPPASRNTSAEIYVICQGYLRPKKIDPRLLDPKHVFKELELPTKKPDIMKSKQKRNREGYEDGNYTLFKTCSISDFVETDDPISCLANHNQFIFDEKSNMYAENKHTTEEIKNCCVDLKVLGKTDFRLLLKWRIKMRQLKAAKDPKSAETKTAGAPSMEVEETKEEKEEKLDKELADRLMSIEAKQRREKKKAAERRSKFRRRVELGMHLPNDVFDAPQDDDLFSIGSLPTNAKDVITTGEDGLKAYDEQADEDEQDGSVMADQDSEEDDSENENDDKYGSTMEKYLDQMYEHYMDQKRNRKKRVRIGKKKTLKEEEEDEENALSRPIPAGVDEEEEEEEEENRFDSDEEISTLIDSKAAKQHQATPKATTQSKQAALWFSRKIFDEVEEEDGDEGKDEIGSEEEIDEEEEAEAAPEEEEEEDEDERDERLRKEKLKAKKAKAEAAQKKKQQKKGKAGEEEEEGFEEVPQQREFSSDEDSDEDDISEEESVEAKAITLAIGKKMLSKKRKRDMIDDAYNRWSFNDENLPKWFVEDEERHNKPELPVTKAEIEEMKERFKAIDARPIKKVAEAKARKKRKVIKKLEKVQNQATKIASQGELSERDKIRAIQRLYKQVGKPKKVETVYIVRKKGQGQKGPTAGKGAKVKIVDKRLKADKRGQLAAERRKGKKGGKRRK
ncbi:pre-rRNA processing protein ftsj3 [Balamuthia mandrillaris]